MKSVFFVRTEDRRPLFVITTSEKSTDFQPLSDEAYVLTRTLNEVFSDEKVSKAQLIAALPEKSDVEGPFKESDKTAKRVAAFLEQAGIPDYLSGTRAPKITGRSTYNLEIADAPLSGVGTRKTVQDLVQFKASAFINEQTKSTFNYEIKRVRAVWDDSLSIPGTGRRGGWRCPPGARFGGQITDRFGRNCGWGVARRLANAITNVGERLDSPGLAERGRRFEDADVARRGNRMARRNARMARRLAREGTEAETLTGRAQRMRERVGRVFGPGDDAMLRTGPIRFPRRQRPQQQQGGGRGPGGGGGGGRAPGGAPGRGPSGGRGPGGGGTPGGGRTPGGTPPGGGRTPRPTPRPGTAPGTGGGRTPRGPQRNPNANQPGQPDWIQPSGPQFVRPVGGPGPQYVFDPDDQMRIWEWKEPTDDKPGQWVPFMPSQDEPTDGRTPRPRRTPTDESTPRPGRTPTDESAPPSVVGLAEGPVNPPRNPRNGDKFTDSNGTNWTYIEPLGSSAFWQEDLPDDFNPLAPSGGRRPRPEPEPETPQPEYGEVLPGETYEEYVSREYRRLYGSERVRTDEYLSRREPIDREYRRQMAEREAPGRRVSSATQRMHEARQKYEQEQGRIDDFFRRPESRAILPINGGLSEEDRESLGLPRIGEQPFEFLMRRWLDDKEKTGSNMSFEEWLDSDADGMSRRNRELTRFASANGRPNRTERPALGRGEQGSDGNIPERRPETPETPAPARDRTTPTPRTPQTEQPQPTERGKRWRDVVGFDEFVDEKYQEYEDRVDAARTRGDNIPLATREEWLSVNADRLAREFDGPAPEERLPNAGRETATGDGARRRRTGGSDAQAQRTASRTPRASDLPEGQPAQTTPVESGRPRQISGRTVASLSEAGVDAAAIRDEDRKRYFAPSPSQGRRLTESIAAMSDEELNGAGSTATIESDRRLTETANDALAALEQAVREGRTEDYERLTREWASANVAASAEMGIGLLEAERRKRATAAAERASVEERNQAMRRNSDERLRINLEGEREEVQSRVDEANASAEAMSAERDEFTRRLRAAETERNRLTRLKDQAANLAVDARNRIRAGEIDQADADAAQDALYEAMNALADASALVRELEQEKIELDRRRQNIEADIARLAEIDEQLRTLPGGENLPPAGAPTRSVRSQVEQPATTLGGRPQGSARRTDTAQPEEFRTEVETDSTPPASPTSAPSAEPPTPESTETPEETGIETTDGQQGFVPRRKMNNLVDRHDPENGLHPLTSPTKAPFAPVPDGPAPLTPDELKTKPLSEVPDSQLGDALKARSEPQLALALKQYADSQGSADSRQVMYDLMLEVQDHLEVPGRPFSPELKAALQAIRESGTPFYALGQITASSPTLYYYIAPDGTFDGRGFIAKPADNYFGDANSQHAEMVGQGLAQAWGFAVTEPRMTTLDMGGVETPVLVSPLGQNLAEGILEPVEKSNGDVWGDGPYTAGKTMEDADSRLGHALLNAILANGDRHDANGMVYIDNGALPIDFGRSFLYEVKDPTDLVSIIENEIMNRRENANGTLPLDPNPMATYKRLYDDAIANGSTPDEAREMIRTRVRAALDDWASATEEFIDGPAPAAIEQAVQSAYPNPSLPARAWAETTQISERVDELRKRIAMLRADEMVDLLLDMMDGNHVGQPDLTVVTLVNGQEVR